MPNNSLWYYIQYIEAENKVCICAEETRRNPKEIKGFIREAPELSEKTTHDRFMVLNQGYLDGLKIESANWPLSDEAKAKFVADASAWKVPVIWVVEPDNA